MRGRNGLPATLLHALPGPIDTSGQTTRCKLARLWVEHPRSRQYIWRMGKVHCLREQLCALAKAHYATHSAVDQSPESWVAVAHAKIPQCCHFRVGYENTTLKLWFHRPFIVFGWPDCIDVSGCCGMPAKVVGQLWRRITRLCVYQLTPFKIQHLPVAHRTTHANFYEIFVFTTDLEAFYGVSDSHGTEGHEGKQGDRGGGEAPQRRQTVAPPSTAERPIHQSLRDVASGRTQWIAPGATSHSLRVRGVRRLGD